MPVIRVSNIMSVSIRYLWSRPGTASLWFKRKVPKDLVSVVGKTWIQFSLGTRDPRQAARLIADHVTAQDQAWEALREARSGTPRNPAPVPIRDQAHRLLVGRGTDPVDLKESEDGARWAFEDMLEAQLPPHLREATEATPQELDRNLPPAHRAALQAYQGRTPFTLTDCLDQYITARPSTEKDARLVFGYLVAYLEGDRDMRKVRRPDVNGFVVWLLEGGHAERHPRRGSLGGKAVSTTTVGRYLTTLRAAFGRAIKENEFRIENVFAQVEIPDQGKDAKERETFTVDQYRHLYAALDHWSETKGLDPLRCILTLVAETGARLAEIVGLAAADLDLSGPLASLRIQGHPWRSLKTPGSTRVVPLSPRAVEAAKVALGLSADANELGSAEQLAVTSERCPLFPGRAGKNDSVSASLVKWVRAQDGLMGTKLGNHSLRHGLKDRLRAAQCPDSIQDAILGHSTPGVGASYGTGYPLTVLAEWINKAAVLEKHLEE